MAVDTVSKRASAIWKSLPLPDGTLDVPDRKHILWQYTGIVSLIQPHVILGIAGRLSMSGALTVTLRRATGQQASVRRGTAAVSGLHTGGGQTSGLRRSGHGTSADFEGEG
jgi:hypothetical protein